MRGSASHEATAGVGPARGPGRCGGTGASQLAGQRTAVLPHLSAVERGHPTVRQQGVRQGARVHRPGGAHRPGQPPGRGGQVQHLRQAERPCLHPRARRGLAGARPRRRPGHGHDHLPRLHGRPGCRPGAAGARDAAAQRPVAAPAPHRRRGMGEGPAAPGTLRRRQGDHRLARRAQGAHRGARAQGVAQGDRRRSAPGGACACAARTRPTRQTLAAGNADADPDQPGRCADCHLRKQPPHAPGPGNRRPPGPPRLHRHPCHRPRRKCCR